MTKEGPGNTGFLRTHLPSCLSCADLKEGMLSDLLCIYERVILWGEFRQVRWSITRKMRCYTGVSHGWSGLTFSLCFTLSLSLSRVPLHQQAHSLNLIYLFLRIHLHLCNLCKSVTSSALSPFQKISFTFVLSLHSFCFTACVVPLVRGVGAVEAVDSG